MNARIATLAGQSWTELRLLLAGGAALWQDLDGVHVEPPPEACPSTSLLWGSTVTDGRTTLVRARLDAGTGRVVAGAAVTLPGDRPEDGDPVEVTRTAGVPGWGRDEQRVSARAGDLSDGDWVVVETVEPTPLVFIDVAARARPD